MTQQRRPGTGRRTTRLNREKVLAAALDLVDRHGPDALTMRRLAKDLGVEAMSLYTHVRDKDALLDGIAETVLGEVPFVPMEGDFDAWVRAQLGAFRSVLLRHPLALTIVATRPVMSERTVALAESVLSTLTDAGIEPDHANRLLWVFVAFVTGHCLNQLAGMHRAAEGRTLAELWGETGQVDAGSYPTVVATFGNERWTIESEQAEFDVGVDLLLGGLAGATPGSTSAGRRRRGRSAR